ncbi:MAG: ATP synthase F1 subunit delta [Lachnospiraceae bacterium]|nr:ATP synthase F1 subunit delta [Lachnospiraceae bacterium]
MAKLVSKTYGEALFEIATAKEDALRDEIMDEVCALKEIFLSNKEFTRVMLHPGIAKTEKMEVLKNVLSGRVDNELAGFLFLVLDKERFSSIDEIFEYFITKMKEYKRIGVCHVTTAVELSEIQKTKVLEKVQTTGGFERMEMHYEVDKSLIGGMRIRIGDRVVDSTIRTKLDELTKQLLQIQLG